MTNTWLYADPGTPCSNEKNELAYMDFTHLAFLLNIYVSGSFKKYLFLALSVLGCGISSRGEGA